VEKNRGYETKKVGWFINPNGMRLFQICTVNCRETRGGKACIQGWKHKSKGRKIEIQENVYRKENQRNFQDSKTITCEIKTT